MLEPSDGEPTGSVEYFADELGYGRHGEGWALLTRTRRWIREPNGQEEARVDDPVSKPLLRAARELRVKAVALIPQLIEALHHEASNVIKAVEKAKKIAESMK